MYTDKQMALLDKVENLMNEKNISQNAVGQLIGVSGTALSQIRNGKYKSNPDKIFNILENYFSEDKKTEYVYSETAYVETTISGQIYKVIANCQSKGGLAVVCGDAGIGKTKAAQKFVSDNPSDSFLITINPCITGIRNLLRIIADHTGAGQEKNISDMWFSIVNKISDGTVLIFDEAQHLTLKTIEVLRSFSDYFSSKGQTLGICFIGNLDTVSTMGGRKAEFAQISNRTRQRKIYRNTDIKREDICRIFPVLEKNGMNAEIDYLLKISQTSQALRGAINLFSNAYDNENYTYAGLVAMAEFMDMEV
ncbi:MAG: AAA family ATPase [Prevotella sp.]|nr:AAA family ATPase [Alistipes senegalensis]MCM1358223.1 AAA family ATPase [Prevotella sp.]MCM1474499.1 AAA family ATPase [Muribaculaceae bacterium]